MGFPENEWHGHDLTSLIEGVAKRLWDRIQAASPNTNPWADLDPIIKNQVREEALPRALDVLDVIHEHELAQHSPESVNCRFFTGDRNAVHELTSCVTCEALRDRISESLDVELERESGPGIAFDTDKMAQDLIDRVLPKATVIPASNLLLLRLLADLESTLSDHEVSGQGFSATEHALDEVKALVADARNDYQEV